MSFKVVIAAAFCLITASISFAEPSCHFFANGKQFDLNKMSHLGTLYYGDSVPTQNKYVSVIFADKNAIKLSYSDNDQGTMTDLPPV